MLRYSTFCFAAKVCGAPWCEMGAPWCRRGSVGWKFGQKQAFFSKSKKLCSYRRGKTRRSRISLFHVPISFLSIVIAQDVNGEIVPDGLYVCTCSPACHLNRTREVSAGLNASKTKLQHSSTKSFRIQSVVTRTFRGLLSCHRFIWNYC